MRSKTSKGLWLEIAEIDADAGGGGDVVPRLIPSVERDVRDSRQHRAAAPQSPKRRLALRGVADEFERGAGRPFAGHGEGDGRIDRVRHVHAGCVAAVSAS